MAELTDTIVQYMRPPRDQFGGLIKLFGSIVQSN